MAPLATADVDDDDAVAADDAADFVDVVDDKSKRLLAFARFIVLSMSMAR